MVHTSQDTWSIACVSAIKYYFTEANLYLPSTGYLWNNGFREGNSRIQPFYYRQSKDLAKVVEDDCQIPNKYNFLPQSHSYIDLDIIFGRYTWKKSGFSKS